MSEEDNEMLLEESIKIEDELDPFEEVSNYNDISENLGETYDENEVNYENAYENNEYIEPNQSGKRARLKRNYSEFQDEDFHYCRACGKSFSRQEHLTRHITTVHEGERKIGCEVQGPRQRGSEGATAPTLLEEGPFLQNLHQ